MKGRICRIEYKWMCACASLALGEYLGFHCQHLGNLWPLVLFAAAVLALLGFGYSMRGWNYISLGLLGFGLSLAQIEYRRSVIDEAHINGCGVPFSIHITLKDDAKVNTNSKGRKIAEFYGEKRTLRIRVLAELPDSTSPPRAGETWLCSGWISGWNEYDVLHRRDLWVRGNRASIVRTDQAVPSLERMLQKLRKSVSRRLSLGSSQDESKESKLLRAMLLGERSLMSFSDKKSFTDAGAMHVFAISGLHVMILARIFILLSLLSLLPLRFSGLVVIPLTWLYVLMVGRPPSAVRAALMASICMIAPMFWRRPNGIVAWAIAFILSHLINPAHVVDAGSGLSFAVMLALVLVIRLHGNLIKRPFVGTLVMSTVAWSAGLPITVRFFGRIALSGLVSGPLVMPAAMFATIAGALGVLLSFISERLAGYANACAAIIMRIMEAIATIASRIPYGIIDVGSWSFGECFAWYFALIAALWLLTTIQNRRSSTI